MARRQAIAVAVERLNQLCGRTQSLGGNRATDPLPTSGPAQAPQEQKRSEPTAHRQLIELREEIELLLLAAERQKINELFRSGGLKDEVRRRIERELDVREAHLTNRRAEE
jgi:hypothetical protein